MTAGIGGGQVHIADGDESGAVVADGLAVRLDH